MLTDINRIDRMNGQYPIALKGIMEFTGVNNAVAPELDFMIVDDDPLIQQAYWLTMPESRVIEWEQLLSIPTDSTQELDERRNTIISRLRGQGKLNTERIKSIVKSVTGGNCRCSFDASNSELEILIEGADFNFKMETITNALRPRVPAHIQLNIIKNYGTWNDVNEQFANWNAVDAYAPQGINTWTAIYNYEPPIED